MAKHPVPKKKVSQSRTAMRYASFVGKKHKKIKNFVSVLPCPNCGNPKLNQKACPSCGQFRGRSVMNMEKEVAKITKIKA